MGGDLVTVTSRLPVLIAYLVNLFETDPTLGTATPPVTVYDGTGTTTGLDAPLKLYVGLTDPDAAGGQEAGTFTQSWAGIGRRARNESVMIHCCAEAWSGQDSSASIATVRVSAVGIVSAVEVLMQADTTGFGGNVLFPDPGVTSGALWQNNVGGTTVRVPFDLTFKSRIGG